MSLTQEANVSPKATKILCGQCAEIIEMPENPSSKDELSCPICKQTDTFEKVIEDARHHATHLAKRALEQKMLEDGRNVRMRTPTRTPNRLRWISSYGG